MADCMQGALLLSREHQNKGENWESLNLQACLTCRDKPRPRKLGSFLLLIPSCVCAKREAIFLFHKGKSRAEGEGDELLCDDCKAGWNGVLKTMIVCVHSFACFLRGGSCDLMLACKFL